MNICFLTTLYNRHTLIERVVASFLRQQYKDNITLLIFNTGADQQLDKIDLPKNRQIILINNNKNLFTGNEYESVGEKYLDAIKFISENTEVISFLDSDDFIMPDHTLEGVNGLQQALKENKKAYKPHFSYLRTFNEVKIHTNVCEGSIFIDYKWFKALKNPFLTTTVSYHNGWLTPLINNNLILVSEYGKPTWVYTWGEEIPTYKTSGGKDDSINFMNTQMNSFDIGDRIISPGEIDLYYKEISNFNNQKQLENVI